MKLLRRFAPAFLALLLFTTNSDAQRGPSSIIAGRTYDGEEITCDLLGKDHIKNIGSHVDGAGMCVFSSIPRPTAKIILRLAGGISPLLVHRPLVAQA